MGLVAGVDSSTQSTKVVLHDADDFTVVGRGAAPHPSTFPPVSEQDPERWWTAMGTALATALTDAGAAARDVRSISVAAQCHGLVALDRRGAVVRPAKLWNDTTSSPQMRRLLERMPAAEWARRTGSVPTAAFTVSKLAWLQEREPENFARTATVLLPHDWLTFRLTGETVTDRSEASGTGYFDATRNTYDHELLHLVAPDVDWAPMLPSVLGPSTAAGTVSGVAADALGLRRDTVVGPGAGDQHASALGLGTRPGDVVYVLGTSGVVFATSATATHDPTGTVDGVADAAGGYLPLVSTLNAAKVTDTFARLLAVDHDELARLALAAEPDGTPVLVAFLDGERKPDLPAATGTLTGITTATTREQVARAAVDGVLFGLLRGASALAGAGANTTGRVIVTGGGARSPAYRQLLADGTGATVHLSTSSEAVADGAALQAAACLGGDDVREVRDALAAPLIPDARPRADPAAAEAYHRYLTAAAWRGGDRP
ncbi:MAG: xylulokinase [Nocardioidaceae bacterium]